MQQKGIENICRLVKSSVSVNVNTRPKRTHKERDSQLRTLVGFSFKDMDNQSNKDDLCVCLDATMPFLS